MVYDMKMLLKKVSRNAWDKKNDTMALLYYRVMMNATLARFKWEGLPNDLKGKGWYIEKRLAENGIMAMARDKETGHLMMLPALPIGGITMYGESPEYQLIAENGKSFKFTREEVALCYDNNSRFPITIPMAIQYSERISDAQRTADVRLNRHKKPIIWKGPKKLIEVLKNALTDMIENKDVMVFDDDSQLDVKNLEMYNSEINFIQRDIMSYKGDLFGEFFGFNGVNYNPANGKKERLVSEEQHSNDEQVLNFRNSYLQCREDFCEEANEKFGLNMSVFYNDEGECYVDLGSEEEI